MSGFRDLEFMWNGGLTERYHGIPTLKVDAVGHHSYNVASLLMHLRPDAPAHLLRAALKHDAAEHIVGDVPAPTKRELPQYDDGNSFREVFARYELVTAETHDINLEDPTDPSEKWILKFCDSADGLRFCTQEAMMGNRHPRLIFVGHEFRGYMSELLYGSSSEIAEFHNDASEHAQPQDVLLYKWMHEAWYKASEGAKSWSR